ncbi:hypothetical protein PIB30_042917 [Stylosanthes scabra]|uniref:Uncharacterized protein n=1 Tax=Stylosanthes scabra TaxID=79078 RepID=A0ABU6VHB0_9FABA|nr:hypothetical protein [Stylosanthes scabra]
MSLQEEEKSNLRTINKSARWETPHHAITHQKNKKNEKNKEKKWKQGIGAVATPGGAATRPENAKILAPGAVAPPRPTNGVPARLMRPRDKLGHIRPKLPSCMARSRPPLGAPTQAH